MISLPFKLTFLPTDILIYLLVVLTIIFILWAKRYEHWRIPWRRVISKRLSLVAMLVLFSFMIVGLLDSIHYRPLLSGQGPNGELHYTTRAHSVLDKLIAPLGQDYEKTYSAPFATHLYTRQTVTLADGTTQRRYADLQYAGTDLKRLDRSQGLDISIRIAVAILKALIISAFINFVLLLMLKRRYQLKTLKQTFSYSLSEKNNCAVGHSVYYINLINWLDHHYFWLER